MQSITVESPAKLNLILRVLGRRKDGYHRLCTLFHRISLRDHLRLKKRVRGIHFLCSHPKVPRQNNLIIRAFHLLKKEFPFRGGVTARLTKRIPVGGGLGGGSSNAASFLLGINRLYRLGLNSKALVRIGRKLGADVPFFLSGARHAIGTGVGERIQPIPFRRRLWFLLICDPKGLSTRRVYRGLRLPKRSLPLTKVREETKIITRLLEKGDLTRAAIWLVNDLTASAERLRPSLKKTREALRGLQLGIGRMSGSGPTLFLPFVTQKAALRTQRRLRQIRFSKRFFLCHSL